MKRKLCSGNYKFIQANGLSVRMLAGLLFLLISGLLYGQTEPVKVNRYGLKEGLPVRSLWDTRTDRYGLIWLSSDEGLSRFDGYNFVTLQRNATDAARRTDIFGEGFLYLDKFDNLLIAPLVNTGFIELLNTRTLADRTFNFRHKNNVEAEYADIFAAADMPAYLLTHTTQNFTVYSFDAKGRERVLISYPADLSCSTPVHRISATSAGEIFIFNDCNKEIIKFKDGAPVAKITTPFSPVADKERYRTVFHADRSGRLWISGSRKEKLMRTDFALRAIRSASEIPASEQITKVWEDNSGNLIFGESGTNYTDRYLLYTTEGKLTDLSKIVQIENRRVELRGEDFTRLINLASDGGFYELFFADSGSDKKIENYLGQNLKEGEYGHVMRGFVEDNADNLYIASESDAANLFRLQTKTGQVTILPYRDKYGNNLTVSNNCMVNLYYQDGKIYGSGCSKESNGYIFIQDLTEETRTLVYLPGKSTFPYVLLKKSDEEIWLFCINRSTDDQAVYLYNITSRTFTSFPINAEATLQKGNFVQTAVYGKEGEIWLGAYRNLIKFTPDDGKFDFINLEEFTKNRITGILPEENRLLITTYGQGVLTYDTNIGEFNVLRYADNDPVTLSNNNAAAILPHGKNQYFISTDNGLNWVDTEKKVLRIFDRRRGFNNYEFNRFSAFRASDGKFYFGGINGFDAFYAEDLLQTGSSRPPVLTRFYYLTRGAEEETVRYDGARFAEKIELPYDHLYFGFDFTLSDFQHTEGNRYKIFLEGIDQKYGDFLRMPSVRYNRLSPGEYTLHVKGFDAQGNESPALSVPVKVLQPFYLTWWFILTGLAVILGLTYLWTASWTRRKAALRNREKQAEERIAKKFTELELEALRAQLNPHFVFNALGAIQHFTGKHDTEKAQAYLADFAKLMRMFLESSKKQVVSLQEELELIKFYVRLEEMRFEGLFTSEYIIDDRINLYTVETPTSLLQPFVENAINHGLFNRNSDGKLKVIIRKIADNITEIQITDNGVGRKRAAAIHKSSLRKHKSRATQILRERITMLNSLGDFKITIAEADAFPDVENCGTVVTVTLEDLEY